MIEPIYYNIFCSLIIALASLYTSLYILFKRERNKETVSFALVWLATALLWFCIGFYTLLLPDLNKFFIKAGQVFVVFTFFAIVYHFFYKIWPNRKLSKWVALGCGFIGFFYIFLIFYYSLPKVTITDWGVAIPPPGLMKYVFFGMIFIMMSLMTYDLSRRIISWLRYKKIMDSCMFFASFSIFLYISVGFFDNWAIHYGSIQLFLIRIIEMFAALIAYLCYSRESFKDISSVGCH